MGRYYYAFALHPSRVPPQVPMNRPDSQSPPPFPDKPSASRIPLVPSLQDCIARYQAILPGLADIGSQLQGLTGDARSLDALIDLYQSCYPLLEQAMWSGAADFHPLLTRYQALFREQDALIRQRCEKAQTGDARHRFLLAIPVADRPPHLKACLESIYQVCTLFGYGGQTAGVWDKITLIVSEDSRDAANIRRHQALVEEYRQKGLQVVYYGLDEQYALLHALPAPQRERLGHLLTTQPREDFARKGQAANRNLCYLKFLQLTEDPENTLYYLVDSDESLCVNRQTAAGEEVVYALPYFHAIDRIFRSTDT